MILQHAFLSIYLPWLFLTLILISITILLLPSLRADDGSDDTGAAAASGGGDGDTSRAAGRCVTVDGTNAPR